MRIVGFSKYCSGIYMLRELTNNSDAVNTVLLLCAFYSFMEANESLIILEIVI